MLTIHERIERALKENKQLKKLIGDLLIIRRQQDKDTQAPGLSALASQPSQLSTPPASQAAAAAPNDDNPMIRTLTDEQHAILNCMLDCLDRDIFDERNIAENWNFTDDECSEVYRLLVTARHIIVGHES